MVGCAPDFGNVRKDAWLVMDVVVVPILLHSRYGIDGGD